MWETGEAQGSRGLNGLSSLPFKAAREECE